MRFNRFVSAIPRLAVVAVVALMVGLVAAPALAQITRGAISGTVRDQSGGVVPGATVVITNVGTNDTRTLVTDSQGFYRAAGLEPGTYKVVTELAGFGTQERREIELRSAGEVSIEFELKPAGVGEAITVTAESPLIDMSKTSPTIGFTTTAKQVTELPLAGSRNPNELILTVPNALSTGGQGTYAINGQRPRNNNYMIDGSDNNDISVTIPTTQVPPEAVQEFQTISNPYSVEFGRNSGGQINIITKSGTNQFRGDFWDYYTSQEFYSLTNIEKAQGRSEPARYNRNQLGGDIGGPVFKDKTFFYALYQWDGIRPGAAPGTTTRVLTPAGLAALQTVPLGAGQTPASRAAVLERIGFLNEVASLASGYRNFSNLSVNGVPIETAQTNYNYTRPSTYKTFIGRADQQIGANDRFTFRYTYLYRIDTDQVSNCNFGPIFCGSQDLKDTNLAASETHIFGSRMLNEFRFSLVRRNLDFPENDPDSPTATISGLFTIGGASNFPQGRVTDAYQFSDTVTWNLTKHSLKFGADIRYNEADNIAAFDSKGTFSFSSLQDYVNNLAFSFAQALQTASWFATQWQSSFFVQDDFRITPDLTVNLGLRYQVSTVPLGMFGAEDPESLGALVPGPVEKDTNNWAPRVGFAWSPRSNNAFIGDGKTVFRGGYGYGYDFLFYNLLTVNGSNYPRVNVYTVNNVQNVYPNLIQGSATPVFNPLASYTNSPSDTEDPESRFYSFTVQRELGDILLEVGYTGSRSYKGINQIHMNPAILTDAQIATVQSTLNANSIPNVQARRLYPQYGIRTSIPAYVGPGGNDVEARSEYNALFLSANKRFRNGYQFGGSYTWSQWESNNDASLGEGGTGQSSQRPQSMFDYESEWSVSNFDRPHRFTVNYIWEIPGPDSGILNAIAGGWQISGITSWQKGGPFTITTGVDTNGDGTTGSDRPNINASGTITWDEYHRSFVNNGYYFAPRTSSGAVLVNGLGNGNAPRNGERGPSVWNTNLSLMKRFGIGFGTLMVRVDVINALNQDSFGYPDGNLNSASFGQNTNDWGRRSMILSGKVSF